MIGATLSVSVAQSNSFFQDITFGYLRILQFRLNSEERKKYS
jgi:hypothetical protein